MVAQLTYSDTPAAGAVGQSAEPFSQRQVDSYLAEGAVRAGDAVERGTDAEAQVITNGTLANLLGVAITDNQNEITANALVQIADLDFDAALVTSNVISITLTFDGVDTVLPDVAFDTSNAVTLVAVATAIQLDTRIATAVSDTVDGVLVTGLNAREEFTIAAVVTLGASQAADDFIITQAASGNVQSYSDLSQVPVMARGRVFVLAGGTITAGAEVIPNLAASTTWATGTNTSTTKAFARQAASAGDTFVIELVGP